MSLVVIDKSKISKYFHHLKSMVSAVLSCTHPYVILLYYKKGLSYGFVEDDQDIAILTFEKHF